VGIGRSSSISPAIRRDRRLGADVQHPRRSFGPLRADADPIVDAVVVQEITDNVNNIFLKDATLPSVTVSRTGPAGKKTLESEWGLALYIHSRKGKEERRYLLDFGFTPDVYLNNIDIMKIDPARVDALIISHGHYDHTGGLMGLLEAKRALMRKNLRLYIGGEDDFCHRYLRKPDGSFAEFGSPLDRQRLRALDVETVLSEAPIVIERHAFTTGIIPRTSFEHVLPNTWVKYGVYNGLGCDTSAYLNRHFTAAELAGTPEPDQHWHEHATCFRLGDRGLVVISSCSHCGIVNTVRRAQQVSGVNKIYALIGGFHLAPAPDNYLQQIMTALNEFDIEHVFPMHCSGENFVELAKKMMPEKLVLCGTGSSFTFSA
jgi:7,8-dihydropterin-6-yl-methyl-4-(beta-D-ribofuranosyl)aminobenzene 5'-phosphate synthase